MGSSSPPRPAADLESFEDACSICLEPFTSIDPPSVTKCKHEYHLHCILEWSQRRIECPVCSRHLVLQDPASQELLSGVERDNNLRSRVQLNHVTHDVEFNNDDDDDDETDFEQRIMRRFASIASRARNIGRSTRQISPPIRPSLECDSPYVQSSSDNPGRSSSSEFVAFSESLKSKFSTASIRYKESISKSTRSLKEKLAARSDSVKEQLAARGDSVKELRGGVQREMSAGFAGVARMIQRLDITRQKSGISSSNTTGADDAPLAQ